MQVASEEEYSELLTVMCKVTVDEILSSNYLPNSYNGVAFIGNRPFSMVFNLMRGIWNIPAAYIANKYATNGYEVILILGRMHNYCIRKMISAVYMPSEAISCKNNTSSCILM